MVDGKTVPTATSTCQTDTATCLLAGTPLASSQQNLCDIYLMLYVQSRTPDDGRKDLQKHVKCYSKIYKFEKLVHLVGFTKEIHYDARTFERQMLMLLLGLYQYPI